MPKYQILRMETIGTPPVMWRDRPWTFDNPEEAADAAKKWSKAAGEKCCVKPVLDGAWRKRESDRFLFGDYRHLSWVLAREPWWNSDQAYAIHKDHYAHAALEKPGFIAYTKSEEDGTKDKQSLLRPGAYLERYFAKILDEYGVNQKRLIDQFNAMYGPVEVKFAETADDIIEVYNRGPQTCIHKDKGWPKDTHPASIYAAGDLQVAYLGNINGKVSARTLVWPAKKIHSRVYGDIARLTQGLDRLGYKWGAPIGARLRRIQLYPVKMDDGNLPQNCFLVPYIDKKNQQGGGHLGVKDMGDHLIITQDGEPGTHHAGGADGYSGNYVPLEGEYPKFACQRCEEQYRTEDSRLVFIEDPNDGDGNEMWCKYCIEDNAWACAYSGNYYTEDVSSTEVDGETWAQTYANMYAKECEVTGELSRRCIRLHYPDGTSKIVSQRYAERVGYFKSELTGKFYLKSELSYMFTDIWFSRTIISKSELTRRAFQCDGCDAHFLLELRHQVHGDDRLFCSHCKEKIEGGKKDLMSKSRKKFEEDRKQLPLIAAE